MATSLARIGRTRPVADSYQVKNMLPTEYRDAATVVVDVTLSGPKERIAIKEALQSCFSDKQVVLPEGYFTIAHYVAVVNDPDEPWSDDMFRHLVARCVDGVEGVLTIMS